MHLQGVGVDAGGAVLPGLPGAPPVAGEVEVVADLPGQLVHGDAEGVGEGDGGGEDGLLVPRFVASELPKADASLLRQLGLGEGEGSAAGPEDLGDVHIGSMIDLTGIPQLPVTAAYMSHEARLPAASGTFYVEYGSSSPDRPEKEGEHEAPG